MLSMIMLVEILHPIINEMTCVAIDSIIENTVGDWELICVVHGEKKLEIQPHAGVMILESKDNLSIAQGYNLGFRHARGEIICALHNDIILKDYGWNVIMEKVGRMGNIAFPMIDESQGECEKRGIIKTESWQTTSCCYILSRALWDELGGLDEQFEIMHGEDIDLFKRAEEAGCKLVRCDPVVIHHRGVSRSFAIDKSNKPFFENWRYFNVKHGIPFGSSALPRLSEQPEITLKDIPEDISMSPKEGLLKNMRIENQPAINLGCGPFKFENSINADRYACADLRLDAETLPIKSESLRMIEAHQLLEHLDYGKTKTIIQEWKRCLKDDGYLVISVPNLERIVSLKQAEEMPVDVYWHTINWMIFGSQENDGQYHKAGFAPNQLSTILKETGFEVTDVWLNFPRRPTPSFTIIAKKGGSDNGKHFKENSIL